ncbi:Hemerythrin HHE cation binding domain-containing protein [Filimonas lacunae]|uniref:Hemerythrin HHE cation binding domain-containing protein n=1 Tax=Filimonas lacunae TaxID=477680 RepID=A0A173MPE7_9BACT|nr:hemerythrin domain-containing protein [Filimonas lacunae]BAV09238.1 hypothetical protein FLA_5286 [Filimonas lacunae]SIS69537.1 Hemerythrin HHE cation binding domain-containing protein [Filimonas lacunae]
MQLYQFNHLQESEFTPAALCELVERDYHLLITGLCNTIHDYLLQHPQIEDLPDSVAELVHLLFTKLEDELKHLFLKEAGIVFPCIRKWQQEQHCQVGNTTGMIDSVVHTQSVIAALMQRIRQLLGNFGSMPHFQMGWKVCLNNLFKLETLVFQWIHIGQNLLYPAVKELTGNGSKNK